MGPRPRVRPASTCGVQNDLSFSALDGRPGNGTNSARPVEKLRNCGNRKVRTRSRTKGRKQI